MASYKPSTLLVEIPNNNIDNELGVKNLVTTTTAPVSSSSTRLLIPQVPVAKSRINGSNSNSHPEQQQYSANNGSVIYAQSNTLKNGFNSTTFNSNNESDSKLKESQQMMMKRSNGNSNTIHYTLNRNSNHNSNNNSNNNRNAGYNQESYQTISRSINVKDMHHSAKTNDARTIAISDGDNVPQEDLNLINSNKWSNGTCTTSDLLF